MPRILKYVVILIASLIALLVLSIAIMRQGVEDRLATTYQIAVEPLEILQNSRAIERGEHLVSTVFFCQECHGEDLAGELYFGDPLSGQVAAKNLTAGVGGVAAEFSPEDWIRAIRHGVDPEGLPLIVMPSNSYYYIGDEDLAAIIAYLESLPPIDNELPDRELGLLSYLTLLTDASLIPAETIEHSALRPAAPEPNVSVEYGKYLATACTICHGPDLEGGPTAGAGLDLTQSGDLAEWTEVEFMETLRNGITPRGEELDPRLMPWKRVGNLTEDELSAIWLYLQTLE
jgi:mono/diheme cytochrome c family protein